MSDFADVMRKINKMCNYYEHTCPDCPFRGDCDHLIFQEPEKVDEVVAKWQPDIYPTILELVHHIATHLRPREDEKSWFKVPVEEILRQRLPRKLANDWNIAPINECGLTKYVEDDEMESEWR